MLFAWVSDVLANFGGVVGVSVHPPNSIRIRKRPLKCNPVLNIGSLIYPYGVLRQTAI